MKPNENRDIFDSYFLESVEKKTSKLKNYHNIYDELTEILNNYVVGGKRVRPAFTWSGWLLAGGDELNNLEFFKKNNILDLCVAIELIHVSGLIHDDIIDKSNLRRKNPSIHIQFENIHRDNSWQGSSEHFGISLGVLAGDFFLAWADDIFTELSVRLNKTHLLKPWAELRSKALIGQYAELCYDANNIIDVEEIFNINYLKTASYTVEYPLILGYLLEKSDKLIDESDIKLLSEIGTKIGLAFQLRDDIIGVFGEEKISGKPTGHDISIGKKTILLERTYELLNKNEKLLLDSAIKAKPGSLELEKAIRIIEDKKIVDDIEKTIGDLTTTALMLISNSSFSEQGKHYIQNLISKISRRKS